MLIEELIDQAVVKGPRPVSTDPRDGAFISSGATILSNAYADPVWIVPNLLPAGLTILAGRPKIGKSWLAMQIAHAVAAGGRLFDRDVEAGRVLFLALEDSERRLQDRMRQQGWTTQAAGNTGWLTMPAFRKSIGPLQEKSELLLEIVRSGSYRLVVIDTLSRAFIGLRDINDSQEVTAALSPLQEISIQGAFGVMALDHHTKPKGNGPSPIDDILGTTAKSAVLDTAMGLYRDPEHRNLRLLAEGRDIEPVDLILRFDRATGCWQSEGETELYVENQREREVLNAVQQLGQARLGAIAEFVKQQKTHTSDRLTRLSEKGLVEKIPGPNGQTKAYRLTEKGM